MEVVLAHARACLETARQMRPMFEDEPRTAEKVVAHALFLRCIDHFQAAVLLGERGLDVESLSLVRGIFETLFVVGSLLDGVLSTAEFEAYDGAGKAKNTRALDEFLKREATSELQKRMSDFVSQHGGRTIQFERLAKDIGMQDLYNGHYRMFSHIATHASLAAVGKYLDQSEEQTTVRYPGLGQSRPWVILVATSALTSACAGVEQWLGNASPALNRAIHDRSLSTRSLGPRLPGGASTRRERMRAMKSSLSRAIEHSRARPSSFDGE